MTFSWTTRSGQVLYNQAIEPQRKAPLLALRARNRGHVMKGIQYLIDDKGEPQAVMIDLKKHRRLWEDFQDLLVARARKNEPRVPWQEVKARLRKQRLLD